jgi:ribosomal protein L28
MGHTVSHQHNPKILQSCLKKAVERSETQKQVNPNIQRHCFYGRSKDAPAKSGQSHKSTFLL